MPKTKSVRDLKAALDNWKANKLPQEGFFSTLDELIETAPQDVMPAYLWQKHLQPGKMLNREGVQFPLKQEEIEYGGLNSLTKDFDPDQRLTRQQVQEYVRNHRPDINIAVNSSSPDYGSAATAHMRAPEGGDFMLGETHYDESGLRHEPSVPGSYEESVTVSPDIGNFQSHFSPQDISWSRTSRHRVPMSVEKMGLDPTKAYNEDVYPTFRLIEEIQSDRHSKAGEKLPKPELSTFHTEEDLVRADAPQPRRGYRTPEMEQEIASLTQQQKANIFEQGALRTELHQSNDPIPPNVLLRREELERLIGKTGRRISELSTAPPDAPYKDPRDHATLEMRKQLLNAVRENDRFLGLTRGSDQIERYEQGMEGAKPEGMRKMYDELYPSVLKKEAGRYGATVGDVEVPVKGGPNTRPQAFVDAGSETFDDYVSNYLNDISPEHTPDTLRVLLDNYEEAVQTDIYPRAQHHLDRAHKAINALEDAVGNDGKVDIDSFSPLYSNAIEALGSVDGYWPRHAGVMTNKSFPAAEITPNVADKIRRIGVPIFNATGATALGTQLGAELLEDDETHPGFAEGGAVEDDESWSDTYLKRPLSGLASMWGGVDPDTGEFVLPPVHNLKRMWNADERRRQGQPKQQRAPLGILESTKSLPGLAYTLGSFVDPEIEDAKPDWITKAEDNESAITGAARDAVGVDAPHGFTQNLMESAGVMAGQVPVPGLGAKKLASGLKNKNLLKKLGGSAVEWLGPTINPKLGNYLKGTAFGGTLGGGIDLLTDKLDAKAEAAQHKKWISDAMAEILQEEAAGDDATDDEALAGLGYAEGGRVKKAKDAIKALRSSLSNVEDVNLRKAKIDEALHAIKGTEGLPEEVRSNLHTSAGGLSDAMVDPVPQRQLQRFGDYQGNILRLLENAAPNLTERRVSNIPMIPDRRAPLPLPKAPQLGQGYMTPEQFEQIMLKSSPVKPPGLAEGGPVTADSRGAPLSQDWYEHYGEGPEHLFMGDRTVKLPEGWGPVHPNMPQPPKTGGGSTLGGLAPLLGLGIGLGQDAWEWWQNRDSGGGSIDPSILEGAGDTSATNEWIDQDLSDYPEPEYLPTWWDDTKQGLGGAFDLYSGSRRGGIGGAGSMLSGAGKIADVAGYDAAGDYLGTAGNALGSAAGIYSGVQQGGAKGYLQAGTSAADMANTLGYGNAVTGAVGQYAPFVGAAVNAAGALKGGIDSKEEAGAVTNAGASALAAAAGAGPVGALYGALAYGIGAASDKYSSTKVGNISATDHMGNVPPGSKLVRTEPDGTRVYEKQVQYDRGNPSSPEVGTYTQTTKLPPVDPQVNKRLTAAGLDPASINSSDLYLLNHTMKYGTDQAVKDYIEYLKQPPLDLSGLDLSNIAGGLF